MRKGSVHCLPAGERRLGVGEKASLTRTSLTQKPNIMLKLSVHFLLPHSTTPSTHGGIKPFACFLYYRGIDSGYSFTGSCVLGSQGCSQCWTHQWLHLLQDVLPKLFRLLLEFAFEFVLRFQQGNKLLVYP